MASNIASPKGISSPITNEGKYKWLQQLITKEQRNKIFDGSFPYFATNYPILWFYICEPFYFIVSNVATSKALKARKKREKKKKAKKKAGMYRINKRGK